MRLSISNFLLEFSSVSLVVSSILLVLASISLAKVKKLQTLAKIYVFVTQIIACSFRIVSRQLSE